MIIKKMKNFKYILTILIILFQTGNVLSTESIFTVNNIQVNKNSFKNKEELINIAFRKGFEKLLRNILKPQIAATYTSDDAGRYVPNFTTNQHLQKTVFRWSINAEGGKYKSFLENFIKDVSSFYNGTRYFKVK